MIWLSPWWLNQYDVHTCSNSNAFSELHSHFHRFLSVLYRQNCLISLVKNCTARKEMIYFGQLSKRKSLNYQIPRGIRSCYCGTMRDGDESVLIWAVKLTIKGKKKKTGCFISAERGWEDRRTPVILLRWETSRLSTIRTTVSRVTSGQSETCVSSSTHLCKFAHHKVGVFKSVVIIIFTAGRGGTLGAVSTPAGAAAVIFWVERIHYNWFRALNLTATEGTSCPLTLRLL